jgi:predicted nucleotidyltransferase
VLEWPNAISVDRSVRVWAQRIAQQRAEICRIGYFGSYARGDWGVGSDLDLIIIVSDSDQPFVNRAREWDATGLPVPTDVLVYTSREWEALPRDERFYKTLLSEVVWIYGNDRD